MTGEQQYSLGIVQFPRLVARYKQIGHALNVKTDDHSAATPLLAKASDEQPQGAAVRALLAEVRALRSELALERQERQADAREFRAALRRNSTDLGAREGPVPPLPGVTGNGSAGRVAKFVGASTIAASRIVEVPQTNPAWAHGADSVRVGINTDAPQQQSALHVNGNVMVIESGGPALWFNESDQRHFRPDYGLWRMIASENALFFEVWEDPHGKPGREFDVQDEFVSFQRAPTGPNTVGNHIIQWSYVSAATPFCVFFRTTLQKRLHRTSLGTGFATSTSERIGPCRRHRKHHGRSR